MLDIVILGLSVTSSWGNGHATTWRSLIKGLAARGHNILFLEREQSWYADNRDDPQPEGATTILYHSVEELFARFEEAVGQADLVIVGSYVPDGVEVGEWVVKTARGRTAFYDIDTPITMSLLESGRTDYLSPQLIRDYDCYLSFTGGPTLEKLEKYYRSRMARTLYCSVDADKYAPVDVPTKWNLGYLGTYSDDRQPSLQSLLIELAERAVTDQFVVAGPQYPETIRWPANVCRIQHLPPGEHPAFYSSQRFTLNITREAMRQAGHSPSVRLFEAAACGVPLISDWWEGLDTLFIPGKEILIAKDGEDVYRFLREFAETERLQLAHAARIRVLREHTSIARAQQLEGYLREMNDNASANPARGHRCSGTSVGGLDTGVELERSRAAASEGTF